MTTPRFHVEATLTPGARIELPRDAAHHAIRVLRLHEADAVVLFDGSGGEYPSHILASSRDSVVVQVDSFNPVERESPLAVTLAQGISAGDRMDLTLQKAVELGAYALQPLLAERSLVRLKGERGESRREHWQRVALSSCEQCGRNRVPRVGAAIPVGDYHPPAEGFRILLTPSGGTSLRSLSLPPGQPIVVAVGPEAGFSPKEEAFFVASGFVPISLGKRVLRTETAGPAALAALNALFGDG